MTSRSQRQPADYFRAKRGYPKPDKTPEEADRELRRSKKFRGKGDPQP